MYGAAFGGVFPIVGTLVEVGLGGLGLSAGNLLAAQANQPLLWIIDIAPFVLAGCGWLIGKREEQIAQLHGAAASERVGEEIDRFLTVSADPLCIVGFDGAFRRVSPGFTKVLGYSLEDLDEVRPLDLVHPDDRETTVLGREQLMEGQAIDRYVVRVRTKGGAYRWLQFSGISVPEERLLYVVGRDVTEDRAAKKELEIARDVAQEASRAKSEFMANMSHELRTPMNGVLGMTSLLLDSDLPDQQREFARAIDDSAHNLLGIINDLLDFSQIESDRMALSTAPFSLADILLDPVATLRKRAEEKGLDFRYEPRGNLATRVVGDPGRVRQIVVNLMDNAVKFTSSGEVVVRAAIDLTDADNATLSVTVRDTGIGIDEGLKRRIFEAFSQADSSSTRQFGGTGLGLTISWQLAKMMGGRLSVDSAVGDGSTFWFELDLPIARDLALAPETQAEESTVEEAAPTGPLRALLVEDNRVNQLLAAALLRKDGYHVTLANNGVEAVEHFEAEPFDFILMDVQMPEMDGLEATRRIREIEEGHPNRTPIIAVTAHALKGDREKCLQAGMDDYVEKPVVPEALREAIARTVLAPQPDFEPARALELVSGNKALLRLKVRGFLDASDRDLDAVQSAMENADSTALASMALAIEGSANRLAMPRLRAVAHQIAVSSRAGDLGTAARLMDELEAAFADGRKALSSESGVA